MKRRNYTIRPHTGAGKAERQSSASTLAAWASTQARREGSDLSKKFGLLLKNWRADVEKAELAVQPAAEARLDGWQNRT